MNMACLSDKDQEKRDWKDRRALQTKVVLGREHGTESLVSQ